MTKPYADYVKSHPVEYIERTLVPLAGRNDRDTFLVDYGTIRGMINTLGDAGFIANHQLQELHDKLQEVYRSRMAHFAVSA